MQPLTCCPQGAELWQGKREQGEGGQEHPNGLLRRRVNRARSNRQPAAQYHRLSGCHTESSKLRESDARDYNAFDTSEQVSKGAPSKPPM